MGSTLTNSSPLLLWFRNCSLHSTILANAHLRSVHSQFVEGIWETLLEFPLLDIQDCLFSKRDVLGEKVVEVVGNEGIVDSSGKRKTDQGGEGKQEVAEAVRFLPFWSWTGRWRWRWRSLRGRRGRAGQGSGWRGGQRDLFWCCGVELDLLANAWGLWQRLDRRGGLWCSRTGASGHDGWFGGLLDCIWGGPSVLEVGIMTL